MTITHTRIALCLPLLACSLNIQADNLMQVFVQAVHNDPTFKQAESTWYSQRELLPIARSQYLTNIGITSQYGRNMSETALSGLYLPNNGYSWQSQYGIAITQPIFSASAWTAIRGAQANVKSATATYLSATQFLMQRTASAYFAVMRAFEQLRYTEANKRAVYRQYVTAEQQFKVGLIAITSVYNAQSSYDQQVATEIANRNSLSNQLENLRAITGERYASLYGIRNKFPLLIPQPADIDAWVHTAEMQNYALLAQNYTVIAARENIRNQASAWLPQLNAVGTYNKNNNDAYGGIQPNSQATTGFVGLSLSWNPIQGGAITAQTEQARYNYLTSAGQLEFVHRQVVNQTRQAYLAITADISQIKADEQSIISSKNSLDATEAGYTVGTRTMEDVLTAISQLYQVEQQYIDDQYDYFNQIVNLKFAAGTLSVRDLQMLNGWLQGNIVFPKPNAPLSKPLTGLEELNGTSDIGDTNNDIDNDEEGTFSSDPTSATKIKKLPVKTFSTKATSSTLPIPSSTVSSNAHYSIQVFAADSQEQAKAFIQAQPASAGQLLSIVQRGTGYKVIAGQYASWAAAKAALMKLPASLQTTRPWIAKF